MRNPARPAVLASDRSTSRFGVASKSTVGSTLSPVNASYSSSTTTNVWGAEAANARIRCGSRRVPVGLLGLQINNNLGERCVNAAWTAANGNEKLSPS